MGGRISICEKKSEEDLLNEQYWLRQLEVLKRKQKRHPSLEAEDESSSGQDYLTQAQNILNFYRFHRDQDLCLQYLPKKEPYFKNGLGVYRDTGVQIEQNQIFGNSLSNKPCLMLAVTECHLLEIPDQYFRIELEDYRKSMSRIEQSLRTNFRLEPEDWEQQLK